MSGGTLVVLDRAGRSCKRFELPVGAATLGAAPDCDIRLLASNTGKIAAHHATVSVHANQTIVRVVCAGSLHVNGVPVSVAALHHNDEIQVAGRRMRWEYSRPPSCQAPRPALEPALCVSAGNASSTSRRRSEATGSRRDRSVVSALELAHRASAPGSTKQVAVVQPQRRDVITQNGNTPKLVVKPHRPYVPRVRTPKNSSHSSLIVVEEHEKSKRKSGATTKNSPRNIEMQSTKASQWIESRKSSPRKSSKIETSTLLLSPIRKSRNSSVSNLSNQLIVEADSPIASPKRKSLKTETPSSGAANISISNIENQSPNRKSRKPDTPSLSPSRRNSRKVETSIDTTQTRNSTLVVNTSVEKISRNSIRNSPIRKSPKNTPTKRGNNSLIYFSPVLETSSRNTTRSSKTPTKISTPIRKSTKNTPAINRDSSINITSPVQEKSIQNSKRHSKSPIKSNKKFSKNTPDNNSSLNLTSPVQDKPIQNSKRHSNTSINSPNRKSTKNTPAKNRNSSLNITSPVQEKSIRNSKRHSKSPIKSPNKKFSKNTPDNNSSLNLTSPVQDRSIQNSKRHSNTSINSPNRKSSKNTPANNRDSSINITSLVQEKSIRNSKRLSKTPVKSDNLKNNSTLVLEATTSKKSPMQTIAQPTVSSGRKSRNLALSLQSNTSINSSRQSKSPSITNNSSLELNKTNANTPVQNRIESSQNSSRIERTSRASERVVVTPPSRLRLSRKSLTPFAPPSTSRKKKNIPLRLALLRSLPTGPRKLQSVQKTRIEKISDPLEIDQTKKAALLLMAGYSPKFKDPNPRNSTIKKSPSFLVKKPSPIKKTPQSQGRKSKARNSKEKTPKNSLSSRASSRHSKSVTILELSDYESQNSSAFSMSSSRRESNLKSPLPPSPKKSALKNPHAKKSIRKTESIKFDFSNLENHEEDGNSSLGSTTHLVYDITPNVSLSPGESIRSVSSRSSRILQSSLGASFSNTTVRSPTKDRTLTPSSPRSRKSIRGSIIVQKALNSPRYNSTTQSLANTSRNSSVESKYRTRTLSPKSPNETNNLYSIVDLVSSNDSISNTSKYSSAGSSNSSVVPYCTPRDSVGRKTRSTIDFALLTSSTPYISKITKKTRSLSSSIGSANKSIRNAHINSSRRSKSLTTPETTEQHISVNSTRISRTSRSHTRIGNSDSVITCKNGDSASETSPLTSRRGSRSSKSSDKSPNSARKSNNKSNQDGMVTPENRNSPENVTTPVLSIQSLLDTSHSSVVSQVSPIRKHLSIKSKRKTVGVLSRSEPKKQKPNQRSKSLNLSIRASRRNGTTISPKEKSQFDKEDNITPKSTVKLIQEAVKNKHSSAKKPLSKRSLIDNLDESTTVKELFNSPVKRKLSQSMTEFSRTQLLEEDIANSSKRSTRNSARSPDDSILNRTESFAPEVFVSPINTPPKSPNNSGIKRLLRKSSPNDSRNDNRKTPLSPKTKTSDKKNSTGAKAKSPKNDLTRVTGVKALYQRKTPKNDLTDVRGVRKLFADRSPRNRSARNDTSDFRGVNRLFRKEKSVGDMDVSGVEELFNEQDSNKNTSYSDSIFDKLVGKPSAKSIYSKSFVKSTNKSSVTKNRLKSLNIPISDISNNIEEWLEQELQKRVRKDDKLETSVTAQSIRRSANKSLITSNQSKSQQVDNNTQKSLNISQKSNNSSRRSAKGSQTPINQSKNLSNVSQKNKQSPKKNEKSVKNITFNKSTNKTRKSLVKLQRAVNNSEVLNKSAATNKSVNTTKSTLPRELQNLATDTVQGIESSKILRARNSSDVTRRSAAEQYDSHTLPIKKRSFVEASLSKSRCSGLNSFNSFNSLPIKKRALVHSTPVKGKYNVTANASELGRVSPIVADSERSLPYLNESPKNKTDQDKGKPIEVIVKIATPLSKSQTKTNLTNVSSSKQTRSTRTRKTIRNSSGTNKQGRPSLVIPKKSPVKAAKGGKKPSRTTAAISTHSPSPKKTRAGRKPAETVKKSLTPKRNTRVAKKTVVATKSSSQSKPQIEKKTRARKASEVVVEKPDTKKSKTISKQAGLVNSKKSPLKKTRNTKAVELVVETTKRGRNAQSEVKPKSKRGRNDISELALEPESKRSRRNVEKTTDVSKASAPVKRGQKIATVELTEDKKPRRSKKTAQEKEPENISVVVANQPKSVKTRRGGKAEDITETSVTEKKTRKSRKIPPKMTPQKTESKRSRAAINNVSPKSHNSKKTKEVLGSKTRGKKLETVTSVESEPSTRRGRTAKQRNVSLPASETRKRKSSELVNEVPKKVAKKSETVATKTTRGRKAAQEIVESTAVSSRQKSQVKDKAEASKSKKKDSKDIKGQKKTVEIIKPTSNKQTETQTKKTKKTAQTTQSPKALARRTRGGAKTTPVKVLSNTRSRRR